MGTSDSGEFTSLITFNPHKNPKKLGFFPPRFLELKKKKKKKKQNPEAQKVQQLV